CPVQPPKMLERHPNMRIRHLSAAFTALLAATVTAACGGTTSATGSQPSVAAAAAFPAGSTMQRLHQAGKVTIGVKFDQPGIGQMNPATSVPEGFDIETGKIIAGALGLPADKIKWVEAVSANRETFLQ